MESPRTSIRSQVTALVSRIAMRSRLMLSHRWAGWLRPTLNLVAFYPLLLGSLVVLLALVWGQLLREYDAAGLIWHPDSTTGMLNGVGVGLLTGSTVLAVYLLDRGRRVRARALRRNTGGRLYQPTPPLRRPERRWYWLTWALLLALAAAPAAFRSDSFRLHSVDGRADWTTADALPPIPTGVPDRVAAEVESVEAMADAAGRKAAAARYWFPLGLLATAVTVFGLLAIRPRWFRGPYRFAWSAVLVTSAAYAALSGIHALSGVPRYCPTFSATLSALLLGGLLTGLAWRFSALAGRTAWLYPLAIGAPLLLFLTPRAQSDYQLPAMADETAGGASYYAHRVPLADYDSLPEDPDHLSDESALLRWRQRTRQVFRGEDQPVIVVAVSGGASASALYTADVLFTLEEQFPGFADRVRIVSGASGGMLGAAYFVAHLRPGGVLYEARRSPEYRAYYDAQHRLDALTLRGPGADPADRAAAVAARDRAFGAYLQSMSARRASFFRGLEQDFLSPLVQKWVHTDMPLYFLPRATDRDRGAALEAAWSRHLGGSLDVPFHALRADEAAGRLPSLVFSPMMIEDGRQLIISNLNLDYMTSTKTAAQAAARTRVVQPAPGQTVAAADQNTLSVTGLEFFRLFPGARDFRLGTAVRMNASFPYISPSPSLPTDPVRHVVDAGYYDNYGTTVATKWVAQHANTFARWGRGSGPNQQPPVVLLRVRCFALEGEKRRHLTDEERDLLDARDHDTVPGGRTTPIRTDGGLFSLTAPATGLFSAWRANMVYRGDERVATTDALCAERGVAFRYPTTECQVNPSLNWALGPDMINRIHADVSSQVRFPAYVANARQGREATVPPPDEPFLLQSSKQAVKTGTTFTAVQATPKVQGQPRAARQALRSVSDLADMLVSLNLADPDALEPPQP